MLGITSEKISLTVNSGWEICIGNRPWSNTRTILASASRNGWNPWNTSGIIIGLQVAIRVSALRSRSPSQQRNCIMSAMDSDTEMHRRGGHKLTLDTAMTSSHATCRDKLISAPQVDCLTPAIHQHNPNCIPRAHPSRVSQTTLTASSPVDTSAFRCIRHSWD
jgi:hypothetical protein